MTLTQRSTTQCEILEAAKRVLVTQGYSGLSTRTVAAEANTQMSQIRYHFGSKEGMILALFEYMNEGLIDRQKATFENPSLTIAQKWAKSCDYLEEDIDSGYVRVFQELTAVGWSNPAVGDAVSAATQKWRDLILQLVKELEAQLGGLGPFKAEELTVLIGAAFVGCESKILLGFDKHTACNALRSFGKVIEYYESNTHV